MIDRAHCLTCAGRIGRRLALVLALLSLPSGLVAVAAVQPPAADQGDQRPERRIAELERLAQARPESKRLRHKLIQAYLGWAEALSGRGEVVRAILVLEEGLFRYPQEESLIEPRLGVLAERCRQTAAENCWPATVGVATRYLELEPDNRELLLLLASAQLHLARYPATLDALERLLQTTAPWPPEQLAELRQLLSAAAKRLPHNERLLRLRRKVKQLPR